MRRPLVALTAALAPAALAQPSYEPPRTADGHPDFSGTWGASFMTLLERPPFLKTLVLTPHEVVILTEDVASLRIIHTDATPPPPPAMTSYEGWSAGRWEGDTLVVETTHIRSDDPVRGGFGRPILVEPDSKLTERFTRVSADELAYQFTVEDPDLYTAPWLAEYSFKLRNTTFYEYACHEGDYSMTNILPNILLGGREGDKRDAARAKSKVAKSK